MALYYLTRGKHYGIDKDGNKRLILANRGADSLSDLTPEQAIAFADKFKSAEVVEAEAKVAQIQLEEARRIQAARDEAAKKLPPAPPVLDAEAAKSGGKSAAQNYIGDDSENSVPSTSHNPEDPLAITAVPAPGSGPTFEIPVTPAPAPVAAVTPAPAPAPAPAQPATPKPVTPAPAQSQTQTAPKA